MKYYYNGRKKKVSAWLLLLSMGTFLLAPVQAYAQDGQMQAYIAEGLDDTETRADIAAEADSITETAAEIDSITETAVEENAAITDMGAEIDAQSDNGIIGTEDTQRTVQPDEQAKIAKKASLTAPSNLTSGSLTYQSLKLYWGGVKGAAYYRIEYSPDGQNYSVMGKTKNTKYKCKNLLTGQDYSFRVCAVDSKGALGSYSAEITAKPYLKKSAVTMISSTADHKITMEWKTVSGAEGYQLYRKTPADTSYTLVATTTDTYYTDMAVEKGITYQYRVRAFRYVEGKSVKATLSAIVEFTMTLAAVQLKTCEPLDYQTIQLTWEEAEDADGYYIYRSTKEDGTYKKIKSISKKTTLSYKDTTVVPGKTYYYKITSYQQPQNGADTLESEASQILSAAPVMDAPVFTSVKTTDSRSLSLSWNKVENASGYFIYRSLYSDKKYALLAEIDSGAAGYEDRAVEPGVTYYYKVKAAYTKGSATGVSLADDCLSGAVAPSAPIGLTLRQTATDELSVSWTKSTGAVSYKLYRAAKGNGTYTCIADGLTKTSYIDGGLVSGKTYYYKVAAVDKTQESTQCLPVSYTVGGVVLSSRTLKVCAGVTKQLSAYTIHEGKIVWKSADTSIATVDSEGRVKGIAYGTTTVTATIAGKSASATVSVTAGKKNGIDVSVWQKDVDWMRVKASGVEFAFLRISNHYLEDYTFETKYANAAKAGVPVGAYCYSRAKNVEEAVLEAETVVQILNGRKLDYPIAMDLEDSTQAALGKTELILMVQAFKDVIESAGYKFVLYSYTTFLNSNVDTSQLGGVDLWIARYRSMSLGTGYSGNGNEKYWQYNSGQYAGTDFHVDGITDEAGNLVEVDVNLEY